MQHNCYVMLKVWTHVIFTAAITWTDGSGVAAARARQVHEQPAQHCDVRAVLIGLGIQQRSSLPEEVELKSWHLILWTGAGSLSRMSVREEVVSGVTLPATFHVTKWMRFFFLFFSFLDISYDNLHTFIHILDIAMTRWIQSSKNIFLVMLTLFFF